MLKGAFGAIITELSSDNDLIGSFTIENKIIIKFSKICTITQLFF